jgi:predicted DNA-binding ribbon-helix-helix protein
MANITLQLDISLVRQLKYIAKQRKMTLSELVTEILKLKLQELEDDRPF